MIVVVDSKEQKKKDKSKTRNSPSKLDMNKLKLPEEIETGEAINKPIEVEL